jgi:hypothetical protein
MIVEGISAVRHGHWALHTLSVVCGLFFVVRDGQDKAIGDVLVMLLKHALSSSRGSGSVALPTDNRNWVTIADEWLR